MHCFMWLGRFWAPIVHRADLPAKRGHISLARSASELARSISEQAEQQAGLLGSLQMRAVAIGDSELLVAISTVPP